MRMGVHKVFWSKPSWSRVLIIFGEHFQRQRNWFSHHILELPSWSSAASCESVSAGGLFSLRKSHIGSIHLHRQCRSHHHHSHGVPLLGSTWSSPSMKDHSSATTWRGALVSIQDQLERLPKTASQPFYSRRIACRCGVHRVTLYIPLEPWRAHINVLNTHACTRIGIGSKQKHRHKFKSNE